MQQDTLGKTLQQFGFPDDPGIALQVIFILLHSHKTSLYDMIKKVFAITNPELDLEAICKQQYGLIENIQQLRAHFEDQTTHPSMAMPFLSHSEQAATSIETENVVLAPPRAEIAAVSEPSRF